LRSAVLASLAIFGLAAVILGAFSNSATCIYAGLILWGLTFGGGATLLQTAVADSAGEGADVAFSASVVVWNGAIALGGIAGGLLLGFGPNVLPWAMLALFVVALIIAIWARKYGFTPGRRSSSSVVTGH